MADLLTARDKLPQVEAQLRNAEMERYVLGLRVQYAPGPLADDASDFERTANANLKNEADSCRAAIIVWDKKLAVLRPIYEALKAEVDAQQPK